MASKNGEVCQASFPMTIADSPMAICTRAPNHRGDHRCMVDYTWPPAGIFEKGSIVFVSRYRAPKNAQPYLAAALEESDGPAR